MREASPQVESCCSNESPEQDFSVRAAAEAAGMSDRRCREWIRRADRGEPLTDRSSRPHATSAITPDTRAQVVSLRRERRTMRQVARIAGVSLSTVARVCKAEGLSRLWSLEPPPPPVRYEHETPGDMLHIDTKRLGRFDRPGHRVTRQRCTARANKASSSPSSRPMITRASPSLASSRTSTATALASS